ncbi:TetR/AcrR family transcriptional regulator [Scandinavium sp. TWS1a]|uniref:TetR/AcrR family transcriptional regulator n=1 Tax=Scandinavium tedordense TaxID=2926521 RepID=UPI002165D8DE|nr:TetR/AcrR family transcriptional regulator [Scandinavium tedordense]MCS2168783.1 TetR/AcrR family transcriptional regulator [Scandinavium tedordense]
MRNTKMKIITAASMVFNELGYSSPSIEKIASASNVSKMTFYKYFPDKESLITEVLNLRKIEFITDIRKTVTSEDSPRQQLKNIFDYYANWIAGPGFNECMFSRAATELGANFPVIIAINDALKTELVANITDILKSILEPELATEAITLSHGQINRHHIAKVMNR